MVKAVIFDMNGVIIVDEKFHNQSWVEFCRLYNFKLTEEEFNRDIMGKRDKDTLNYLFKRNLSEGEVNKYANERDKLVNDLVENNLNLPEGLLKLLERFKKRGLPLAIATSARRGYVDFILESFRLREFFPLIITAEDVVKGKPDPEIYLKVADKLGIDPESCLVFEDSIFGIAAAKSAGMKVVAITSSHTEDEIQNKADWVIKSFKDFDGSLLSQKILSF